VSARRGPLDARCLEGCVSHDDALEFVIDGERWVRAHDIRDAEVLRKRCSRGPRRVEELVLARAANRASFAQMVDPRRKSGSSVPAKISPPRLSETYHRTALFKAIDHARKRRVVWISGPAGAGKTSAVTTYLAARRLRALWYNVDARDGDVANLFHYLAIATKLQAGRRAITLPAFAMEHLGGVAAFARSFFEELYRQRPNPSAIVLDDYQDAGSDVLDEVLREALSVLPVGVSAFIVSRADPPPRLARLVASGDISLLGTDDLRLTPHDTAGLVRAYRPDLKGARLRKVLPRIIELSNGWAAALTLLLQSQKPAGHDPLGVEEFSERLFDYFATEILDKATLMQREFLLKTSVVPSLEIGIAARLTKRTDAARRLAELERRSFLVQRLGTSGVYRYHPLLRSFLLRRAQSELGSDALHELHREAAEALVEIDQIDEAMEQFETAQEVMLRTRLILSVAPSYVPKGRGRTIETWIGRLPPDWVEKNGWLLYWQGVSCFGYADARPRELLERAYAHFERDRDAAGLYLCCAAGMQAAFHEGVDFRALDPWIERFESLEKAGLPCPPPMEPMLALGMAMAAAMRRLDTPYHRRCNERAKALSNHSEDPVHHTVTIGWLAVYLTLFADNLEAATTVEMIRASAQAAKSSTIAQLTLLQADALCRWAGAHDRACLALVGDGLALAARTGVFTWNNFLQGVGVSAALALEDLGAAAEFLTGLAESAQQHGGWRAGFYYQMAGWEALARGDGTRALHYAEQGRLSAETVGPPFGRLVGPFQVARAMLQLGRKDEALAWLKEATLLSQSAGVPLVLHGCYLVESDCLWDDDRPRALAALREGLRLAHTHGYYNMYGGSRELMTRTAVRALEHDIEVHYIHECIARRQLTPHPAPLHLENWPWRYRFRALGQFQIRQQGDSAAVDGRGATADAALVALKGKPLELLQAIVAFGGRGVRDTTLMDALWPDADGDTGRRVFDTTLHRLRKQLGDEGLVRLVDRRVFLDERHCWVDVWVLQEVLESSATVNEATTASELTRLAARLLSVLRGPLLADLGASTGWGVSQRKRLSSKCVDATARLGRALEQARAFTDAAALYERVLKTQLDSEELRAGWSRCALAAARAKGEAGMRQLGKAATAIEDKPSNLYE
jgi:tetratricopeptide (TPR) repeat protein